MKLNAKDWQTLQPPLLALAAVLLVVFLLNWYTIRQQDLAFQAMQAQQSQLEQARRHYQESGAEKEAIIKYLPHYQDLIDRGFVGEERRIEWIDHLRNVNQQYKLFGITYSIGSQEKYKPSFSLNSGPFELHRSAMKIESALLHEGDLLTIINAMSAANQAPFTLRDCTITRIATAARNKFLPNLNASCEIDWLTITEPQKTGVTP
ncbi:MAG TPA: hypothetical protein PKW44_01805 [Methylophilaceae bacterium]|nr:hypothetical protein [Methylophilaceae bacterium]HQR60049.1 hypothetical protein [Methylophilaceae bacterium]